MGNLFNADDVGNGVVTLAASGVGSSSGMIWVWLIAHLLT